MSSTQTMGDEVTPTAPVFNPESACCSEMDVSTRKSCTICDINICYNCGLRINGKPACRRCGCEIAEQAAEQELESHQLPGAIFGGIAGAVIAGLAWATISIVTNLEIGFAAVGIGWLAAKGAVIGSGNCRGSVVQSIAVATSALGLFLGRYFSFAWEVVQYSKAEGAVAVSYFSPRILSLFMENISDFFGPWDLLWLAFAFSVAWGIPAREEIDISERFVESS